MSTTTTPQQPLPTGRSRVDAIRDGVLTALGRPAELFRVTVVPLWGNRFRVNVMTGNAAGVEIPQSYFVTADEAGAILNAEPPLRREY